MNDKYIVFNGRDELNRLKVDNIVYFEADGNYTTIVTTNNLKFSIGANLSKMEAGLSQRLGDDVKMFMRIGKRFIVNMSFVCHINVQRQRMILTDYTNFSYQIGVSKEALRQVKELLANMYKTQDCE